LTPRRINARATGTVDLKSASGSSLSLAGEPPFTGSTSRVRTRGPNRSTNDDLIQVHPFHHRLNQSQKTSGAEFPRADINAMHMQPL
jgi:hypothetical protein